MFRMSQRFVSGMTIVGTASALWTSPAVAGNPAAYAELLKQRSPALVTIRFVLKIKMGGAMGGMDQESETEITGVVIDPKGVVLCAHSQLEGFVSMMRRMMGGMGGDLSATPTDLKVLIGDDTEGVEAELLSHDTELDLAWIKLKEAPSTPLTYVDFSSGIDVAAGQDILSVRRLDKFFGRTATVTSGRIAGKTDSPRKLLIPDGGTAGALGLPVFTPDGKVVGVAVLQSPDEEDVEANPMIMLSRMSSMQDMMSGFILPAASVVKATRQAMASQDP
jgi:S1-C subfamily serine protease